MESHIKMIFNLRNVQNDSQISFSTHLDTFLNRLQFCMKECNLCVLNVIKTIMCIDFKTE